MKTERRQSPQHYARRTLRELCVLDGDSAVPAVAAQVVQRIRNNRLRDGAGSYLLVDESGRVFVLSESAATSDAMVRRNSRWLVGLYCAGARVALPTSHDIAEDIRARLAP